VGAWVGGLFLIDAKTLSLIKFEMMIWAMVS
jgi:hypothetical protein